ncbi:hypothetical protein [Priestia megaterium]
MVKREGKKNESNEMGRKKDMLKELVRKNARQVDKNPSPVDYALNNFFEENGYKFLEMISDEKILKKHLFKQMQILQNNDDDFLNSFKNHQKAITRD